MNNVACVCVRLRFRVRDNPADYWTRALSAIFEACMRAPKLTQPLTIAAQRQPSIPKVTSAYHSLHQVIAV